MSNTASDPVLIERDLDQTRSRLGSHLSELQGRLSPGQVLDDLVRYFRGREGADFGRSLLSSIRANPLPAALTGIGLTWLMASTPRQATTGMTADIDRVGAHHGAAPDQGAYDAMAARLRTVEQGVVRQDGEAEPAYTDRLEEARGQAVGLERHPQETTESFGQRIRDALGGATQTVIAGTHDLRDQAAGVASSLGSTAQDVAHSVAGTAQGVVQRAGGTLTQGGQAVGNASGRLLGTLSENPALLGALGLAVGALLGALLPQSDQEEAALGEIAGQARNTAHDVAQDVVDRGSHVAHEVLDAGRDSVQKHGLTSKSAGNLLDAALSGDLAGDAKQVAQDVLRTGDEAIHQAGQGRDHDGPHPA
jgi:hypothetical protein